MNFHRDRNLIIGSVLFFAIIGSFLLGCSEGSDSSPVGALMTDINNEDYKTGGRTIDGTFNTDALVATEYGKELGGIPVTISKYIKNKETYVEIDKTVTSLNNNTGKFKFTGLNAGSYKISTPKTDTFKAFEEITLIKEDMNASDSTTFDDITVNFTLPHITDEMSGLNIKVVSANNGRNIDSATVKIDNKAVNITNENGITEVNEIPVGFHDIEISHADYENLTGKFQIQEIKNSRNALIKPNVFAGNPMHICLVEKGHNCSITGTYFNAADATPKYVALYKYNLVSNIDNIEYYKEEFLKLTKTSYGIDGTPDGSFKFLDLDEGFYQLYVFSNTDTKHPDPKPIVSTDTYQIYNLSNYDKSDIANYRWQPLNTPASERTSRPINLKAGYTVYWTNIDTLSTK